MSPGLPKKPSDVAAWAQGLRAERTNETGRALVDVLEHIVQQLVRSKKPWEKAQLAGSCERVFRAIGQADRSSEASELAALRERAERQEELAGRFRGLH